ncbi:5-oxoprolinase subunit PxpA [Microbulbifer variabilis]|uniref:5-oxoprolinase subunit PxpA n=1 Tax=Microbulbifer variabilis TaxID=266805 RepID=A0ABY4VCQ0_9GAMM|nr:5-oxoprolinase subunit PxpA [Microbulbifer variabilis]USD22063.1 5-oxoprolinase subunit PxpA [Microbulbifer variabilis]
MRIDINCDLGEGSDLKSCIRDTQIMPFISRCNIACGAHAGNRDIMRLSIFNAQKHHLKIGAHPGYPDRENFGRKSVKLPINLLLDSLFQQIEQLQSLTTEAGVLLDHVKLHGALYNDAEADRLLSKEIISLFAKEYPSLKIIGLANGAMESVAIEKQCTFYREGFIDRHYLNKEKLAPRNLPGSVLNNIENCLERAIALAKGTDFTSYYGTPLKFSVDTICLHGDNPAALKIAKALVKHLQHHGLNIQS